MADKMRRHSRRARHLMKTLRRSKHASTQDMAAHELVREIDRRHGFLRLGKQRGASPRPGMPGHWRPMTHRARRILAQLRKTKVWRLQKQLVRELQKELVIGRRAIDKARDRARRAAWRAKRAGHRTAPRCHGRRTRRQERRPGGGTRRPHGRTRRHACREMGKAPPRRRRAHSPRHVPQMAGTHAAARRAQAC